MSTFEEIQDENGFGSSRGGGGEGSFELDNMIFDSAHHLFGRLRSHEYIAKWNQDVKNMDLSISGFFYLKLLLFFLLCVSFVMLFYYACRCLKKNPTPVVKSKYYKKD